MLQNIYSYNGQDSYIILIRLVGTINLFTNKELNKWLVKILTKTHEETKIPYLRGSLLRKQTSGSQKKIFYLFHLWNNLCMQI